MSDRTTYVLDTSVLLAAGKRALTAFGANDVVLPLVVVTELESKRNDPELGWLARQVLGELEELRLNDADALRSPQGVVVNSDGGTVRIELNHVEQSGLPDALRRESSHDIRILAVAAGLASDARDEAEYDHVEHGVDREPAPVVLVSRDLPMRLLASAALGLTAEDYRNDQAPDDGYAGIDTVQVEGSVIDEFFADVQVKTSTVANVPSNTALVLQNGSQSALAVAGATGFLRQVPRRVNVFGLKSGSAEQSIAMDHLLNPDIGIVSIGGRAGTGKSTVALAAGLELVLEQRDTHGPKKIIVFRPMYSVGGQDLGYLPGTAEEKMTPWAQAVFDALGAFVSPEVMNEIDARELIEVLPLTHIRGRSLHDTFVIVDEAQSLERNVLLTVLSRLGKNSKTVLTHDLAQRDNLFVGRHDGVAIVIDKLKGEPLFAHITLTKSERSPVADLVTRLLDGK